MATHPDGKRRIVIIGALYLAAALLAAQGMKYPATQQLDLNAHKPSAYFLTRHPAYDPNLHSITLLEATAIAAGASGKAGGLLALWAYPPSIVPLSFRLHAELAAEHDGAERWGYRAVQAGSVAAKAQSNRLEAPKTESGSMAEWQKLPKQDEASLKSLRKKGIPEDLDWFVPEGLKEYSSIGDQDSTAQVHPYQFTTSMAELAQEKGVEVKIGGHVDSIDYTGGHVKSVTYTDRQTKHTHTIHATDIVISAGPWTSHVFPDLAVDGMRAHSVTINANISPYALFTDIELPKNFGIKDGKKRKHGSRVHPEIYARPNGEVYACGEVDELVPLPSTADLVQCDSHRCQDVVDYISSISDELRTGEVTARQACYLPSIPGSSSPVIGGTGIKGMVVAAGHTCWGIQNSCATGKLVSELVFDGEAKSAEIGAMDPKIYM